MGHDKPIIFFLCGLAWSALLLTFAGCSGGTTDEADSDKVAVTLQLDFYPEASHGGFFQAKLKGYFADVGIDEVNIVSDGPMITPMQGVALGKAQFGICRMDDLLMAIELGLPLKAVMATYQHDPLSIMFHADQNIKSFEDMDGRKLMAIPGAGFVSWIQRRYNLNLNLVPLNFDLSHFVSDSKMLQQAYITSQPFYVEKKGVEVECLLLADSGFDPMRVLYVNEKFATKHPVVVRDFAKAALRGIEDYYIKGDRSETDAYLQSINVTNQPDLNDFTVATIEKYKLLTGRVEGGYPLGEINLDRMREVMRIMVEIDLLKAPIPVEEYLFEP